MIDITGKVAIDLRARDWCKLSYPDHPRGCPNFDKHPTCPPKVALLDEYFDLSQPLYLAYVTFDLASHIQRMLQNHHGWSERQARCVLYWQAGINKKLRELCEWQGMAYTLCPEAMGVNVIKTARKVGLPIEVKPQRVVHKIAFLGTLIAAKRCCQEVMEF